MCFPNCAATHVDAEPGRLASAFQQWQSIFKQQLQIRADVKRLDDIACHRLHAEPFYRSQSNFHKSQSCGYHARALATR